MTREEMRNRVVFHYEQNRGAYPDLLDAAIALIRAETLEEAAMVIENDCHDDMTRAEEAAAIRALKRKP